MTDDHKTCSAPFASHEPLNCRVEGITHGHKSCPTNCGHMFVSHLRQALDLWTCPKPNVMSQTVELLDMICSCHGKGFQLSNMAHQIVMPRHLRTSVSRRFRGRHGSRPAAGSFWAAYGAAAAKTRARGVALSEGLACGRCASGVAAIEETDASSMKRHEAAKQESCTYSSSGVSARTKVSRLSARAKADLAEARSWKEA